MTDTEMDCAWLHGALERLPFVRYPFSVRSLPENGIYFLYEDGEINGHTGNPRIVRVGTSRDGNFRSRIGEHFFPQTLKLEKNKPAPKDRSIFRKNIGRALINRLRPSYLPMWEIDFTTTENIRRHSHKRDIGFEEEIEKKITEHLQNNLNFRFIEIKNQKERMGKGGLESRLIGTLSHCSVCRPSSGWLGNSSPKEAVKKSGLWLIQHLNDPGITEIDKGIILGL